MRVKNKTHSLDLVQVAKDLVTTEDDVKIVEVMRAKKQNSVVYLACKITNKTLKNYRVYCKIVVIHRIDEDNINYTQYDEETVPEELWHCPSSILKLLSPNSNKNAKEFREVSREVLAELANEKSQPDSLTNLRVGTQIILISKKASDGSDIILEKICESGDARPYWQDVYTKRIYRKCDIQACGYEVY